MKLISSPIDASSFPRLKPSDYYYPLDPEVFGFDAANEDASSPDMLGKYRINTVPFASRSQVQDCTLVPSPSERDPGFGDFSCFGYESRAVEHGDEELGSGLMAPESWPAHDYQVAAANTLGSQSRPLVASAEEVDHGVKAKMIGRYSSVERKCRIMRYLKKKNQRNFNKTIKYECRKTLADKRVRVRGRFAKNNEESENILSSASARCFEQNDPFLDDTILEPQIDDDWLQAAMAGLLNMPYPIG